MELLKSNQLILSEANDESDGPIELLKLVYCEARRSQVDQWQVPKYIRYVIRLRVLYSQACLFACMSVVVQQVTENLGK